MTSSSSVPAARWSLGLVLVVSVIWAAAFVVGRRSGQLYPVLAVVAVVGAVVCVRVSGGWRAALIGQTPPPAGCGQQVLTDALLGLVVGGLSLGATYGLYPVVVGVVPAVADEVARLYAVARVTPATLVPVVIIALAEEGIWRRAGAVAFGPAPFSAATSDAATSDAATFDAAASGEARQSGLSSMLLVTTPASLLYAAAQLGSGSLLLGGVALAFGLLWGWLTWWRGGRITASLVAHACWTPVVLGLHPLIPPSA